MDKEKAKDLYGGGLEVGKSLAIKWIFSYMENEGLEFWLTSAKDGNITALQFVPWRRVYEAAKKHLGIIVNE